MERRLRTCLIGLFVVAGLLMSAAPAGATTYAPVNRPGPKLSVPAAKLAAALKCDGPLAGAAHPPVLLVPGPTLNPTTDFSYGWEPALRQLGYRYCTIDLPGNGMADIQTAGEYVVYAIRTMHAVYGGRIDIIGHSQGGVGPAGRCASGPTRGRWSTTSSACRLATTGPWTRSRSARSAARRRSGSSAPTRSSSPR